MRDELIGITPRIKKVSLRNIGMWEHLDIEFGPGINVITQERNCCGKSTILRAIKLCLFRHFNERFVPTVTDAQEEGEMIVELFSPVLFKKGALLRDSFDGQGDREGTGNYTIRMLKHLADTGQEHECLIMDDEVFCRLDQAKYQQAANIVNSMTCQLICVVSPMFEISRFKNANVLVCLRDDDVKHAAIKSLSIDEYEKEYCH